ncbi:MAG: RNA polymerase sigma factor [Solirubrobacteraceae bacterium]
MIPSLDAESSAWIVRLRGDSPDREQALSDLHALLLRATRFELRRRTAGQPHLRGGDREDIAHQSADDALLAILAKLDDYRGESRFTTWAYKFALLEAAVNVRQRAWQRREIPLDADHWALIADRTSTPDGVAESRELINALGNAIDQSLTPHQRAVLVAITLNDVPIDVLAQRLNSTRGALYKTLHDARRKLRAHLRERNLDIHAVRQSE